MKSVLHKHIQPWEEGEGNSLRKYYMMMSKKTSFNKETTCICGKLTEAGCMPNFRVSGFSSCRPGAL